MLMQHRVLVSREACLAIPIRSLQSRLDDQNKLRDMHLFVKVQFDVLTNTCHQHDLELHTTECSLKCNHVLAGCVYKLCTTCQCMLYLHS